MKAANLALRFLLELAALGAFGYWGATAAAGVVTHAVLAVGLPLGAAAVWGTFVAPRARVVLPAGARAALGLLVLGAAALALADRGHGRLAAGFATVAVGNALLLLVWRQDHVVRRDAG